MVKVKAVKPGPPKAKKATPLKAKKTPNAAKALKSKISASPKFIALSKTNDGEFRKKTVQKRKAIQRNDDDDDDERRGVIVLSNIPHGFFEGQMRRYFRQFGVLENVRLVRSKKTGQSCGYAYVEFQHYEVAKIVAKHMNGYLTFGKIMKCIVVNPSKVSNKMFKGKSIRPDNCPGLNARKGAIRKLNKKRTKKQLERMKSKVMTTCSKRIKELRELGVDIPMHALVGVEERKSEAKEEAESSASIEEMEDLDESRNEKKPILTKKQRKEMSVARDELAEKIMEDLVEAKKEKTPKKSKTKTPASQMVIEVDESDDEVVLKTPPNAVKKYVKMGDVDSTPKTGKATPKGTPKQAGTVAVNGTPKSGKKTPKQAKTTPVKAKATPLKATKSTPKITVTPKSAKRTPKSTKTTPKSPGTPPSKQGKKMETDVKASIQESDKPEGTSQKTPKGKNKTPKSGKLTLKALETIGDEEGPNAKSTTPFKAKNRTPKVKEGILEMDAPKSETQTPSRARKAVNTTPKLSEAEVESETPSKAKNKTPRRAKSTPKVSEPLEASAPGPESATPKLKNKTPKPIESSHKASKSTPITHTPRTTGEETNTPKVKKTPKNRNETPAANQDSKGTPGGKRKTPKSKGSDENEKMTPKLGYEVAVSDTPKTTTPKRKKGNTTTSHTPKATPGKRRQSEGGFTVTEITPTRTKAKVSPGRTGTPKCTPKMSPGKRRSPLQTPGSKVKKIKVLKES